MEILQYILELRAKHERMAKALEKESEKLYASASKADTPEKRNRVKNWQIGLDLRISYYNSVEDLLQPKAIKALEKALQQSNEVELNQVASLEERNNFLRWHLDNSQKEIGQLKKKWLIAKQLLEQHTDINPSLVSWMKLEDVGLNYLQTA